MCVGAVSDWEVLRGAWKVWKVLRAVGRRLEVFGDAVFGDVW